VSAVATATLSPTCAVQTVKAGDLTLGAVKPHEWWASKAARGTAPARCTFLWGGRTRCRAFALDGETCGRH